MGVQKVLSKGSVGNPKTVLQFQPDSNVQVYEHPSND